MAHHITEVEARNLRAATAEPRLAFDYSQRSLFGTRIARGLLPVQRLKARLNAAGSFFLGQQQVLPASWRGSPALFLPELAVLLLMIFWLLRVRLAKPMRSEATVS